MDNVKTSYALLFERNGITNGPDCQSHRFAVFNPMHRIVARGAGGSLSRGIYYRIHYSFGRSHFFTAPQVVAALL